MMGELSYESLFKLDGRVALITGASSGLGARFAEVAAASGASVVLVGRRADRLEALQAAIENAGGSALAFPADVTDDNSRVAAFEAAEKAFGIVDLFVANAGVGIRQMPLEVTAEDWRRVMTVDLDAVFFWSQEAGRRMVAASRPGAIITISSIAGLRVSTPLAPYAIAKAGVIQATKLLASELGPKGVRVNTIAPGYIASEMTEHFLASDDARDLAQRLPLRKFGVPSDLDGAFLLLASEAGRLMTGATIVVDSGNSLL